MDGLSRLSSLMDGPPTRAPERVREDTVLRGRRVQVLDDTRGWVGDLRAADNPYWYDGEHWEDPAHARWPATSDPPDGADRDRAVLTVAVCTERDWYEWARTRRRPEIREYPAYAVWVE